MSTETDFVDPRSNVEHSIEEGQVYEDARTDEEMIVLFKDDDTVLAGLDGERRLEPFEQFERNVGAGRYSLVGEEDVASGAASTLKSLKDRYEEQDGRKAAHKASAIDEAIEMVENNGRPDDNETVDFESVDGIGAKAASALRKNGITTKGDVRDADREDLVDVDYMGEKNTDRLLDHVSG